MAACLEGISHAYLSDAGWLLGTLEGHKQHQALDCVHHGIDSALVEGRLCVWWRHGPATILEWACAVEQHQSPGGGGGEGACGCYSPRLAAWAKCRLSFRQEHSRAARQEARPVDKRSGAQVVAP